MNPVSHSAFCILHSAFDSSRPRKGVVLLAVLIVIVLLSLAVYHYSDLTLAEYKSSHLAQRRAQALALADSGVHYAAAILSSSDGGASKLNGNPYNNSSVFKDVHVQTDQGSGVAGTFTLLAPPDPQAGDGNVRYGVIDESGKINLNAMMLIDPSGQTLLNILEQLPNMTPAAAASIVDWMDPDDNTLPGGAESDYYQGQNPSYSAKNGPLDSLEEILLVQGVTPELLFGQDRNPYGLPRSGATAPQDQGWSRFLTIYSREMNVDLSGNALINLNSKDMSSLSQNLTPVLGNALTNFIILARQYGTSATKSSPASGGSSSGNSSSGGSAPSGGGGGADRGGGRGARSVPGDPASAQIDLTKAAKQNIRSLFGLVNAQVTVPGGGGNPSVVYPSPLNDPGVQQQYLPALFNQCTISQGNDTPARININTAPQEVLQALETLTSVGLTDSDVQSIVSNRPSLSSDQPVADDFASPAWLITKANLDPAKLAKLEKYITTKSQVYRVHVQGTLDVQGITARVEAIIDTNGGQPRILSRRNLTELGKALDTSATK
jgi:type II secretory pathway component PulK